MDLQHRLLNIFHASLLYPIVNLISTISGPLFGFAGISWPALLLHIYSSCPFLGRDISLGMICDLMVLIAYDLQIQLSLKESLTFHPVIFQARSLPTDKLRIWYFAINSGVYLCRCIPSLQFYCYYFLNYVVCLFVGTIYIKCCVDQL